MGHVGSTSAFRGGAAQGLADRAAGCRTRQAELTALARRGARAPQRPRAALARPPDRAAGSYYRQRGALQRLRPPFFTAFGRAPAPLEDDRPGDDSSSRSATGRSV